MNRLYAKARRKFLRGELLWRTTGGQTFRALLVDGSIYVADPVNDEFLTDIPIAARYGNLGGTGLADLPELTIQDLPDGVADADDFTFAAIPAGPALAYLVIVRDSGSEATSELVHVSDEHAGLPITPNGVDILMAWDDGVNRIFKV